MWYQPDDIHEQHRAEFAEAAAIKVCALCLQPHDACHCAGQTAADDVERENERLGQLCEGIILGANEPVNMASDFGRLVAARPFLAHGKSSHEICQAYVDNEDVLHEMLRPQQGEVTWPTLASEMLEAMSENLKQQYDPATDKSLRTVIFYPEQVDNIVSTNAADCWRGWTVNEGDKFGVGIESSKEKFLDRLGLIGFTAERIGYNSSADIEWLRVVKIST